MTSLRVGALVVILLFAAGTPAILAMQATPEPAATPVTQPVGLVYPPAAIIHGATLGEWNARYWQWVTSLPVGENPGQDATGELCGYGQNDPVFFIPGNMPPCTVPAGIAIFLPVAGTECSTLEPPPFHGEGEDELAACAAADGDRYTNISVVVNGEEIPEVERFRAASPAFTLQLPEENILAVSAETGRAVADGYALVLAPLPPGEHEIVMHVEVVDGYALPDKTLRLTVVKPDAEG
ncbi:MAG TPA: hypothetical protein VGR22_04945 [Thermomicrobiales bacterium]|nr:hypothetical protein [Thermomicrobiales bacterium]